MPKNIPNTLTVARIVLSAILFFITDNITLFFAVYAAAGFTDIADGYIARKHHLETIVGAKLDSLADFLLLAISLLRMVLSYQLVIPPEGWILVGIAAVIRIANAIVTKVKFRQWGMLHTICNKLTGCFVFIVCPLTVISGRFPMFTVIIALLSSLEEMAILFSVGSYDPNIKSYFHCVQTAAPRRQMAKGEPVNG